MKRFSLFLFLLCTVILGAQPVNDDCGGIIDLGVPPFCPNQTIYSNMDATPSDIGFGNIPGCFNGGTVQNDVWFVFTTSDTIFDYTIVLEGADDNGNSILNPQIALYRGDCQFDGLSELACISAENGEVNLELDILGLTPNLPYFIRINDYSASATPNWGDFRLCVKELEPVSTIDEGGSMLCSGELFDSGGPDGDYMNSEDYTFSICPSQPNQCIIFTLDYYNIEASDFATTDQLIFYDSDTADPNTIISIVGGDDFSGGNGGGGGVCFQAQASSGCMTIQFISDGQVAFEGFAGSWQCSAQACETDQSITVGNNTSNEEIINFITTPQTTVTITNIDCPDGAYGTFEAGDNTNLGLERGLILTSGEAINAIGPNDNGGLGTDNGAPGDADLDSLSIAFGNGQLSQDACILELDVFVATDELVFEYIFGSEEYPEYVNDLFNDIFAFLISGPGITGNPNIGNQENIAVLPDGNNTFVEINSVNNLLNWEYYRDNTNGLSVQYDGLTSDYLGVKKSLTARKSVEPCNTYHLKLAIADRGDGSFDSGVFISELKGSSPDLAITFNSGVDYLIEDCTDLPDELVISLNSAQTDTISYNITVQGLGTATQGIDYTLDIPSVVTFLPGETELTFPITVLSDLEIEPIETIIIVLSNDFGCGEIELTSITIDLHDKLVVSILPDSDTTFVCQDSTTQLMVTGAATYFWTPPSIFSDPQSDAPIASPTESMWVQVVGNVGICSAEDSIFLQIIDPQISIETSDPTAICQGDSVLLGVDDNVNHTGLFWSPTNGVSDPNATPIFVNPQVTTTYFATVDLFGCTASDSITIDVSPFTFPDMASDTTICENYSVQLATLNVPGIITTTYSWTPIEGLDNPSSPTPIATPDGTTTYQLIAISGNEACQDTSEITITVLPADVDITNPDTTFICLGESLDITAVTSLGDANNLEWTSSDMSLTASEVLTVNVMPEISTSYFATYQVGACLVLDSIFVRVDSLPNLSITAMPEQDPYCQGDIVTLISTTYEPSDFPDIEHQWVLGGPGYETPDTLWNMVFSATDTFIYQRISINNACIDTAEILINVQIPPNINLIPADTTICTGESVQLLLTYEGDGAIEWSPEVGCTDCFDPIVTPSAGTTTYMAMSDDACPSSASASITAIPPPMITLVPPYMICDTETDATVLLVGMSEAGTNYSWSSPDDPNFNSTDPLVSVLPPMTTTYVLSAENECTTVSEETTVTVIEEPTLMINDITICFGDEAIIEAISDLPDGINQIFEWSINGTIVENGQILTLGDLTTTTDVSLRYTYGNNCGTLMQTATITVIGNDFSVSLSAEPDSVFIGGSTVLTANIESDPPLMGDIIFTWFQDGIEIGTSSVPTFTATNIPGDSDMDSQLSFMVTVSSSEGCTRMAEMSITVQTTGISIPNVFTPNGDDLNDIFKVYHTDGITVSLIQVFNRWGEMVFESTTDGAWNGMYKDQPAQSDVYIYRVIYTRDGEEIDEGGEITLLR